MRQNNASSSLISRRGQSLCALTRARFFTPQFSFPNPLTQGFSINRRAVFCHISVQKPGFCPAPVPLLSRTLSRWILFDLSGLGGLSRCPAANPRIYVQARARMHTPISAGQAGQRDNSYFLLNLSFNINRLDRFKTVPLSVPHLSRSIHSRPKSLKLNKIMGRYCYGC